MVVDGTTPIPLTPDEATCLKCLLEAGDWRSSRVVGEKTGIARADRIIRSLAKKLATFEVIETRSFGSQSSPPGWRKRSSLRTLLRLIYKLRIGCIIWQPILFLCEASMVDIFGEQYLTPTEATKLVPGRPCLETLWRWQTIGCRGVKLESIRLGGKRLISRRAVANRGSGDRCRRLVCFEQLRPHIADRKTARAAISSWQKPSWRDRAGSSVRQFLNAQRARK